MSGNPHPTFTHRGRILISIWWYAMTRGGERLINFSLPERQLWKYTYILIQCNAVHSVAMVNFSYDSIHYSWIPGGLAVVVIHYKNYWFSFSNMTKKVSWYRETLQVMYTILTLLVLKQKDSWTIGSTLLLLMLWPLYTWVLMISNQSSQRDLAV